MGLDIGDKRIGISLSDPLRITAQGLETYTRKDDESDVKYLAHVFNDNKCEFIVSGLPKNMNGTLGPQGEKVIKFCELLEEETGKWSNVTYMPCTSENNFIPEIPDKRIDIVYLCYPNNPTGTTLTKPELKKWVDYALANDTLLLFDAAYEAYIQDADVPHSIYEIKGAKKCAIEFRSFSKTAGFTGVRCGYTVVPKELTAATLEGDRIPLNRLWNRRQCTKFNGTSYITQRAAEAVYSAEGKEQIKETINYYMTNAGIMKEGLEASGLKVYGGVNAPYLWVKTPNGLSSWRFFEQMLYEANVVGTPGVGFGPSGEGYIRLTAFGERNDCIEAMRRIKNWL